jgi:TolB-like protein
MNNRRKIMFRKTFVLLVFLAVVANYAVFPQTVAIDTALANAAKEIAASVPQGTKIAVLNMSSDYVRLSDYVIDELIVKLVNTRQFQVVPRSMVELELAKREFDFQMTGNVSDESQKRLGQFLGAGTIISGSVTKDSANSYRIVVNAIDLQSFTYQSSYRISVQNDSQIKALIAGSGGTYYEDYTTGERLGMGVLNIFGGVGSIINGYNIGWVVTGLEVIGIGLIVIELLEGDELFGSYSYYSKGGFFAIGTGIVFGLIIPFFHHKPNNTGLAEGKNQFPFNLRLVSSDSGDINGFGLSYNLKL